MKDIVEKISKILDGRQAASPAVPLLSPDYEALPLSPARFHGIPDSGTGRSLAFVDGGQAELAQSADFSLAFLRVSGSLYKGRKRSHDALAEWLALVQASGKGKDIAYTTELFPVKGSLPMPKELLSFESSDESLRLGLRRSTPSFVVSVVRRFAELEMTRSLLEKLEHGDALVLDGSLGRNYTNEDTLLLRLRASAEQRNIHILGLSKTNTLFTTEGESLGSALAKECPDGKWMYSPIGRPLSDNAPHLSFIKLHQKAKQPFLVESFRSISPEEASLLASHSADPVFLGYPYGLIEADRKARVSNQEAAYLRTRLSQLFSGHSKIRQHLTSKSPHGVLDSIHF